MVDIPDSLRTVFTATVEEDEDGFTVDVPMNEVENGVLVPGETYRVAILDGGSTMGGLTAEPSDQRAGDPADTRSEPASDPSAGSRSTATDPGPPVEEGEIREVSVESIGDQGDGIAKVDRGYVVIVPGVQPGDRPTVEIERVRPNVAFASVVEGGLEQR
ncbi:TRAM domain-containing protein [Halorubrum vacuolatum]|uniref:Predicted RNA-binding protein, contains TRAM domain n=1 Tax=Halorubrum vacuolatum TaxID=63740 RepID=A0A238UTA5_HALVU|nr:TRAM domain-containing protein [Halorubrum vacuolatum]SNR25151.1 Predicted RNA-binding protein, contains TRAM domain [Halorubrum vacuolatum]